MSDERRQVTEPSDDELVAQARSGDDSARSALVARHHEAAFRVALSMVQDRDIAMDVVQEAFLRAFRGLRGFRGDASFRTWLLTIAANEARGALRKRSRRRETGIDAAANVAAAAADPAEAAVTSGEAAKARRMLGQLPEKQRLSVSLRIDEGLSFKEIGEVIGSSEGAARVNYFHGIRRLREMLE